MSIEGQGHFITIYFPGFVCFVLYLDKISGERLQDHWSSGFLLFLTVFLSTHIATKLGYVLKWTHDLKSNQEDLVCFKDLPKVYN